MANGEWVQGEGPLHGEEIVVLANLILIKVTVTHALGKVVHFIYYPM